MKQLRVILTIGIIEILIGTITLFCTFSALILGTSTKPFPVLFFVTSAACTSFLIGIGIIRFSKTAYQLLLYFSSVVILSKVLIFMGVFTLNGALETSIPAWIKDGISLAYHGAVIYYLLQKDIKEIFQY